MSVLLGKAAKAVTGLLHSREVRHDALLFIGAFVATGFVGNFASGAALSWDALSGALTVALHRTVVMRLAGK